MTSDAKHVEIGLTDKADSARWIFAELWRRGISPGQVLVAGDEFGPIGGSAGQRFLPAAGAAHRAGASISVGREPTGVPAGVLALGGGPQRFLALLEDQLRRRQSGDVPELGGDEAWTVSIRGFDPEVERVRSSLLTIADGVIGTSGSPVGSHPAARPRVLAAGLYEGEGPETELVACPVWTRLDGELPHATSFERQLDLHTGLLRQRLGRQPDLESIMFSSLVRPGTAVLRAKGVRALLESDRPLEVAGRNFDSGRVDGAMWAVRRTGDGGLAVAAAEHLEGDRLDRLAAYVVDPKQSPDPDEALRRLGEAEQLGFESLLSEHRRRWAERWEVADIRIEGDDELQRLVRFALFHLMGAAPEHGEAAVGARGLTGPAYRDTSSGTRTSSSCRSSRRPIPRLRARCSSTDSAAWIGARAAAARLGRAGARFPWESAAAGVDVTPSHAHDHAGRTVAIRTGELEEHIVADVAWAAGCYVDWSGDAAFAAGPGRDLFIETARYWASRIRLDREGRAHIYGVIGPDEYHEPVDDNAFTNVMARWNLRRAAEAGLGVVPDAERRGWLDLAASLVDGYNPQTRLYEQFAGFDTLEPLVIADIAPHRPIAARSAARAPSGHGGRRC